MAMLGERDKPSLYNIIGKQSGAVIATAYGSKVLKLMAQLQKDSKEELEAIQCDVAGPHDAKR